MDKIKKLFSGFKIPEIPLDFRRNGLAAGLTVHIVACVLLSLFAFAKGVESTDFILPIVLIGAFFLLYAQCVGCNMIMVLCISLLMNVGTVTLVVLQPEKVSGVVDELWLATVLAIIVTAVFSFIEKRFKTDSNKHAFFLMGAIWIVTVILTVLLRLGDGTNGTYAWLYFGDHQLQVTSLFVPAFVLYETVLYVSPLKNKHIFSLIYMFTLAGSLFICNELGTLIIIFFLWIINMLVFGELANSLKVIGIFGGLGGIAIGICAIAKSRVNHLTELGETAGSLTMFLSQVFSKISKRITEWINIKELPEYEQSAKAWRGIFRGGLLGTNNEVAIGHEIYDYTFAAILQRMGFLFGLIIVFLYVLFFFTALKKLSDKGYRTISTFSNIFAVGSLIAFFVSSIIPIFTNTAFFPLIGVSLPLISSGVSSGLISRFFIFVVILSCKERLLFKPINFSKSRKKTNEPLVR
ncbi:MAG: FtsW/RodA/SpoVE family cell cycle protein [Clostridia bacterium]|nr:FtsW/RodA/SpoVE family cell cycle protein [Clostridia bacterium]